MESTNTESETIAKNNRERVRGLIANNSSDSKMTPPSNSENDGTPPALPESTNCETDESSETNCEIPEPFEGFDGERPEMGEMQPGGPHDMMIQGGMTSSDTGSILHPVAYLSLGATSLMLSLILVYACFSKFFHKKPGEVFNKWQKFLWYCVIAILLTAGIITLCYFIPIWVS